jgi:single-stranded DNA-binding protein
MTTGTPTLTLTGYLGRDVEIGLTAPREYTGTTWDPIIEEMVPFEGTTRARDWAKLSLALHRSEGTRRTTEWIQLRAWDLDRHPDEARIRTARKGQRVEVQGYWETHRYTDPETARETEYRYLVVTAFRSRPGRLLSLRPSAAA